MPSLCIWECLHIKLVGVSVQLILHTVKTFEGETLAFRLENDFLWESIHSYSSMLMTYTADQHGYNSQEKIHE